MAEWKKCSGEMPDDELSVLIAMAGGEVSVGFREGGEWRCYATAGLIEEDVIYWMDFPEPPK